MTSTCIRVLALGLWLWVAAPSFDAGALEPAADQPAASGGMPEGLIPLPDFSGDLVDRSRLTGDWNGSRAELAAKGVQFELGLTQTYQAVTQGGRDTDTAYGGSLDYIMELDLHRMGVMQGALLKVRAESRFGESVNLAAGPLLPVSTDGFFPLGNSIDEDIDITITNLTYVQFLSEHFGVMLGKVDTLDGDQNEFASGRGNSQFLNANFVIPVTAARFVPYTSLAAGVIWMPSPNILLTSLVMNTDDSSTTSGFSDFGDGTTSVTELKFQYRLFDLPGGQSVGYGYGFDNDYAEIGTGRLVFHPGQGLMADIENNDDTWAFYWNGWQYLWTEEQTQGVVHLGDGRPDHQGVGVFARYGAADNDANPIQWTLSGGIGGRGVIPTRDEDVFGVGYFYLELNTSRLIDDVGIHDHTHGFEAFYNIAVTPAAHLTFDVQVIDSPFPDTQTAVIVGGRLHLAF